MRQLTVKELTEGLSENALQGRYRAGGDSVHNALAQTNKAERLKGRSPALIREIEYRRELKRNLESYGEYEI